jgi:predicted O-methyltransferase YrrM
LKIGLRLKNPAVFCIDLDLEEFLRAHDDVCKLVDGFFSRTIRWPVFNALLKVLLLFGLICSFKGCFFMVLFLDANLDLFHSLTHYECVAEPRSELLLRSIKSEAFQVMSTLEGWCTTEKASVMIDLIAGTGAKKIVEIGVFGGKSLIPMAIAVKQLRGGIVYGVDSWDSRESISGMDEVHGNWWGTLDHESIFQGLLQKINELELQNEITLIRSSSESCSPIPDIDFLHIDGNHSEKASLYDVRKWVPLVKSGGIIVLDDLTWMIGGIRSQEKTVTWLNESCIKVAEFHGEGEYVFGIWRKP